MNRRNFLKTSAAVAAAATVLGPKAFAQANPLYPRSVHFMYPELIQQTPDTFQTITSALGRVNGGVSFLSPLFLNEDNPTTDYADIYNYVKINGIKFGAAVGGPGPGHQLMDGSGPNETCLNAYDEAAFQPYLRVDNLNGFYGNTGGEDDIKSFLREAINMGFHKIMLNPWPQMPAGQPNAGQYMPITESDILPYIDACFQNADYQSYLVIDADIQNILTQTANQPQTPQILINYESPGPQKVINKMTFANQLATFKKTLSSVQSYPPKDHLHFALPFTGSYDPLQQPGDGSNMWDYYMVPTYESFV